MIETKKWSKIGSGSNEDLLFDSDGITKLETKIEPLSAAAKLVKDKSIVLIGEETHGTKEFYEQRIEITKELIESGDFSNICIEGDWPAVALLHSYVTQLSPDITLEQAWHGFDRFPHWMWCNDAMREFLIWLREHNEKLPANKRCGIFGLDLYSLETSIGAINDFLTKTDPANADVLKSLYSCFDRFSGDIQYYGFLCTQTSDIVSCRNAVIEALEKIVEKTPFYAKPNNGVHTQDLAFINEMNARLIVDAEHYYRSMYDRKESSWEIRDTHFFDTLERVRRHCMLTRGNDNCIVWAHNSHLGNAKFTNTSPFSSRAQELNLGQLIKTAFPDDSVSIGQFTHTGTVLAAAEWGSAEQSISVNPSLSGSWEDMFHIISTKTGVPNFVMDLRPTATRSALRLVGSPRIERAIGVIYCPKTERQSHYFEADLDNQFDIAIWFDITSANQPFAYRKNVGRIEK